MYDYLNEIIFIISLKFITFCIILIERINKLVYGKIFFLLTKSLLGYICS